MKIIRLNTTGFILPVKEHETFKKYMLDYIEKQPRLEINDKDKIYNTDYEDVKIDKPYIDEAIRVLGPYLGNICERLKLNDVNVKEMWYQQYVKGNFHQWHTHPHSGWAGIYYIELPSDDTKTQLYDSLENKVIDNLDLREGDLFVFPATLLHRSPENTTDNMKTILSFNFDFNKIENIWT